MSADVVPTHGFPQDSPGSHRCGCRRDLTPWGADQVGPTNGVWSVGLAVFATRCTDRAGFDGRNFTSQDVTGRNLVAGTEISLSFEDDNLSAGAGCNTIFGQYEITGGKITVPRPASTKIACDPDRMDQDRWLSDLLVAGVGAEWDEHPLVLTGEDTTITLNEHPEGDSAVIGTLWKLKSISRSGNSSSVPGGDDQATLKITNDGLVRLFTACNHGGGTADVGEGSIEFSGVFSTEMYCAEKGVMRVETLMHKVLRGRAAVAFDGPDLILSRKGLSLTFQPG